MMAHCWLFGLHLSFDQLNTLALRSSGQKEMQNSGLSHDIHGARGKLRTLLIFLLIAFGPSMQHGRSKDRREIM